MRVAYLVNQYPMPSQTFIRREIAALEEQGFDVSRYALKTWKGKLVDERDMLEASKTHCLRSNGALPLVAAVMKISLASPKRFVRALSMSRFLASQSDRSIRHHLLYFAQACRLKLLLRASDVNHLHVHFATNATEVALLCKLLGGPSYSFTVHGPEEFDRAASQSYSLKIEHAKFVAAITSFCRSQLYRWAAWQDWPKIKIVRCGLDGKFLKSDPNAIVATGKFVCVGRLCEQKAQILLIEAMAKLKKEGVSATLTLVGDGPMREACEDAISRFDLSDSVTITGWATGEEVYKALSESSVFVMPSFAEGLPVVIMEAFAMGRPVISSYIAGIPELVKPEENGWLVPAGDIQSLTESMREAVSLPPDQLSQMGLNGRRSVLNRHSAKAEADRLIDFISAQEDSSESGN